MLSKNDVVKWPYQQERAILRVLGYLSKIQSAATKKKKKKMQLCTRNIMKLLIIAAFVSVLDEVITSLAQNTLRAKIALFPLENLTEMLPL